MVVQRVVIELDGDRGLLAPVENPRDLSAAAQAAARTRSLQLARLRDDFDCHVALLESRRDPRPDHAVRKPPEQWLSLVTAPIQHEGKLPLVSLNLFHEQRA